MPFDINGGKAFINGDWGRHEALLDALAHGMEQSNVNGWCWWNYNPDNLPEVGDFWNKEDLSVVSRKNKSSESQPRAIAPLVRPYPVRLMGVPVTSLFDRHQGTFSLRYLNFAQPCTDREDTCERLANVIFLPTLHFGQAPIEIKVSDGDVETDSTSQSLMWYPADTQTPGTVHWLRVGRAQKGGVCAHVGTKLRAMELMDWLSIVAILFAAFVALFGMNQVMTRVLTGRLSGSSHLHSI